VKAQRSGIVGLQAESLVECGTLTCLSSQICCTYKDSTFETTTENYWCIASTDSCPTLVAGEAVAENEGVNTTIEDTNGTVNETAAEAASSSVVGDDGVCQGSGMRTENCQGLECCDGYCHSPGRTCCGPISCDGSSNCCTLEDSAMSQGQGDGVGRDGVGRFRRTDCTCMWVHVHGLHH